MSTAPEFRKASFALLISLAMVPSLLLCNEFLRVHGSSDAQLSAAFVGAAQEDVFGFGFWVFWLGLALAEFLLLGISWFALAQRIPRRIVMGALVAFFAASALGYSAYAHEFTLWSTYVSASAG